MGRGRGKERGGDLPSPPNFSATKKRKILQTCVQVYVNACYAGNLGVVSATEKYFESIRILSSADRK